MEEQYIQKEINIARQRAVTLGNEFTNQQELEIRNTGFIGRIPAFSRLAIVFEKQKKYLITTMIQPFRTTLKGFCSGGLNHGQKQGSISKKHEHSYLYSAL
jgi:hypothetical protein